MMRLYDRLFPVSVRLEENYTPACWRCGRQLFLNEQGGLKGELAPGDDEGHPWVWVCLGCVTNDDREAVRT
jgi:hypothetical protein